jgi:2-polyprenyl-3-methyl-5-hydroxy-6-metoxy-1,4-benzoquinol methylase
MSSTDQAWEKWGQLDPYFAVYTHDKFHNKNLNRERKAEFFASGKHDVDYILNTATKINQNYLVNIAVDFGCGVGRLTIPLARKSKQSIGLDVSVSMLKEARANIPTDLRKNLSFKKMDNDLVNLPKNYNLVVSLHVFQHIPKRRGYAIANELLKNLDEDGFAALHFTVHESNNTVIRLLRRTSYHIFFVNWLINLYVRRPLTSPNMQINIYKLNKLIKIFRDNPRSII